jgi:hypothetical protein
MGSLWGDRVADCVALYGSTHVAVDLQGWLAFTLEWMAGLGRQPDRIGIRGADYPETNTVLSFAAGSRKLKETGFGPVTSVTLSAGVGSRKTGTLIDNWDVECSISTEFWGRAYVCCDRQLRTLDAEHAAQLVLSLRRFYEGCYGFAYSRPFRCGPSLYVAGISAGSDNPKQEVERISKWSHLLVAARKGGRFPCDALREIYRLNFLCDRD